MPIDTAIRYGVLPNGLTYYIRNNATPTERADFYLVNKVGSVMEEDNERGLAHFLEHMAFKGTKNYSEFEMSLRMSSNGIISNANTGFDRTLYYMSNVPTQRWQLLDSVLLILRDMSCNLLLDSTFVEQERYVIESERTHYQGYQMRMQEYVLPIVMRESRFANRIPIGTSEVIAHATPKQLKQFYQRWYRPDRQALIVVGDFDTHMMEMKVRRIFGHLQSPDSPGPQLDLTLPDHKGLRYVCYTDAEADASMINLMFLYNEMPLSQRNTLAFLKRNITKSLVVFIINRRLAALNQQVNSPWRNVGVTDDHLIDISCKEALTFSAYANLHQVGEAMNALITEARRLQLHGVTAQELSIAKSVLTTTMQQYAKQVTHHETSDYVNEYVDHFLNGGYIPGVVKEAEMSMDAIAQVTLDEVNDYIRQRVAEDNVIIMMSGSDSEIYPNEKETQLMFNDIMDKSISPHQDKASDDRPLIANNPTIGEVLSLATDTVMNVTMLKLSNGADVILKPTNYKSNEVLFCAVAPGGYWQYDESHIKQLNVLASVIEECKLGGFTQEQLRQKLATKSLSLSFDVDDDTHYLQGECFTSDLETLFQLCYLYFTDVSADTLAFQALMKKLKTSVNQQQLSPDFLFSQSAMVALYGDRPYAHTLTEKDLSEIKLNDILAMYHHYVENPSQFTYIMVGDFDVDEAARLFRNYISGLPNHTDTPLHPPIPILPLPGNRNIQVSLPNHSDRSQLWGVLSGSSSMTMRDQVMFDILNIILSSELNQILREIHGITYGVEVETKLQRKYQRWNVNYQFNYASKTLFDVTKTTHSIIDGILTSYAIDDMVLGLIKQKLISQHETNVSTNSYWLNVLCEYVLGLDRHTEYLKTLQDITAAELTEYINSLNPDINITVSTNTHDN